MGVRVVFPDMGKDPSIQLIEKTITENGTYDAITDGANGYSKVNVNVEGGGGSSDFSTAEVTIVNNAPDNVSFNLAFAMAMSEGGISATVGGVSSGRIGLETVANAVLYNGSATIELQSMDEYDFNIEVSGDIQGSGYSYFITGDCTITIS